MKEKTCPHCHLKAPRVNCENCGRDMCEDCMRGTVCGSCEDRATEGEEDKTHAETNIH